MIGGTEGIGASLVRSLVKRGSVVTMTGSSLENSNYLPKGVDFIQSNISTMRGAQQLGAQLLKGRKFDTVVFCGGFRPRPEFTGSGDDEDLESSYLSRFIIVNELLKSQALMGRTRIYILAYPGDDPMLADFEDMKFDWTDYKQIPSHINTVLFNDAMIREVARRYPGLRIFGVNPGFLARNAASDVQYAPKSILSRGFERMLSIAMKSPEQYVERSLIHLIASPMLDEMSGAFFSEQFERLPPKKWMSKEKNTIRVWENSEQLVFKALG